MTLRDKKELTSNYNSGVTYKELTTNYSKGIWKERVKANKLANHSQLESGRVQILKSLGHVLFIRKRFVVINFMDTPTGRELR